jgi:hypothetical protein
MVEITKRKAFKTIQTPSSASLLPNNLSTVDGRSFLVVKPILIGFVSYVSQDYASPNMLNVINPKLTFTSTHQARGSRKRSLKLIGNSTIKREGW